MYRTKEEAINAIRENDREEEFYDYNLFKSIEFDLFRDDKDVVLKAIENSPISLKYSSERLKDDKEIVLYGVNKSRNILEYASDRLKDDKDFVLNVIKNGGIVAPYLSDRLKDDKETVLKAIEYDMHGIDYASDRLKDDKNFIFKAVELQITSLNYLSDEWKDNKDLIIHAIKLNSNHAYTHASYELQKDRDVVLKMLECSTYEKNSSLVNSNLVNNIKNNFSDDKEVMLMAISLNELFFGHCSKTLQNDKEVVLAAINMDKGVFRYASTEIQDLCKDKDPIKTLESVILHEQLQKIVPPKTMEFARNLSEECKQNTMEQSNQVAKPKARMKI